MLFVSDNACALFKLELDCKTVPRASLVVDSFTWNVCAENRRISRLTKHTSGDRRSFSATDSSQQVQGKCWYQQVFPLAVQVTLLVQINGNACVMK